MDTDKDPTTPRPPTVALALGAGGAKGLAHIGAIEAIESRGFRVMAIAGSSIGALIGGIHAMGKLTVYRDWVRSLARLDVLRLVDWTLSGGGLIKGDRIIGTLRKLIGDTCIEDLPIAFTAVATDLDREREVWLGEGPLFDAIRASIAIPTVFRPHPIGHRRLLDGALLNPVPVTPLIRANADYLIAISMDGPVPHAKPETVSAHETPPSHSLRTHLSRLAHARHHPHAPGAFELLMQSMDLMQANLSRLRLAAYPPDLLIQLPRNVATAYEFYRAGELVERGRACAEKALDGWHPTSLDAPR